MCSPLLLALRHAPALVLWLATAACAAAPAAPGAAPPPSAAAAELMRRCAPLAPKATRACYDSAFVAVLRADDARAAMQLLDGVAARDPGLRREGHIYAHGIGIAAYTTADEVGRTFARCTPNFQSGCYHGVIQAYFLDAGQAGESVDSTRLNALCGDYRSETGDHWLWFQCTHGVGHGLMMILAEQLPRALQGCDQLASEWEQEVCYGGAFMENIVAATDPHHGPAGHAMAEHAHDEHQGHAMAGEANTAPPFPPLDPADPHYPCSAVGERYQDACYLMQTSVVLLQTRGDFRAARRLCDTAPPTVRRTCYISFGRDAAAYGDQQPRRIIALCAVATREFQLWCHVGATKNLIDRTADPADGVRYCSAVADGAGRAHCFEAVGEQIYELEREPARRAERCATAPARDVAACLRGADVSGSRTTARTE